MARRKLGVGYDWDRWSTGRRSLRLQQRAAIVLLTCSPLFIQAPRLAAQSEEAAEYGVKLAFLYNFAQFIQWPPEAFPSPGTPFTICVAGTNPFTGEMEQDLLGRTVSGHTVKIQTLKPQDDPRSCHILFVRASERTLDRTIVARGSSTLTVGETKGFADRGGVINLMLDGNKLRFEINPEAATQTQLKISSKLLALARIVSAGRNNSEPRAVSPAAFHPH
jgi:YfiR/HmsC-like